MKRYFIYLLILALAVPFMAVPASASQQGVIDAVDDLHQTTYYIGQGLTDVYDTLVEIYDVISEYVVGGIGDLYYYAEQTFLKLEEFFPGIKTAIDSVKTSVDSMKSSVVGMYEFFTKSNITTQINVITSRTQTVDGHTYQIPSVTTQTLTVTKFQQLLISRIYNPLINITYELKLFNRTNNNTTGNQFADDLEPIETQVDDWIEDIETAPTISIEDIETEVDKLTEFETDANYLSILSGIFLNEAFLTLFTWSVIMAMLGYILFGKR